MTRRLHAFVREGADENSWQSRPRHAVLSPTLGRLPPPRETAADLARVMLLLDVSTIARNVGHDLIFATSCCTHSDLGGCADSDADALPARQTTRLCCWHACASVWIATSFRPRPRMHDMTCSSPNTTTDSTTGWPLLSGRTNAAASQRPYQRSAARLPHGQHTQGCGKFHARCTARSARLSHAHGGPLGYRTSPLGVLASWITSLGARGSPPLQRADHDDHP